MSEYKYDAEYLEVGDTFEGGPIEQSQFISAILGAGGTVKLDGNKVLVTSLPKAKKPEAPAPVVEEPVVEEPVVEEPVVEEPVVEEPVVEEPVVETPKPKYSRKTKSAPVEKVEE